ncbi:hypothetical protein [Qipengyuania sp.]|uniref:hypothetical protein n=1 Tax=Qipengyuania sp. TaxID=2004515 RepID=UPI0035C7A6FF
MILLLFGWMLIGSAFIGLGWSRSGWRARFPLSIFNAALVMSVGIDLVALGYGFTLFGRIEQILRDGQSFAIQNPFYFLGAVMVIAGKSALVWVAAMGEGRTYRRPFWFAYLAALASWFLIAGVLRSCS